MDPASPMHSFLRGFRDGTPFLLMMIPFGMVFGIVGTEAGLNLLEVMGFSVLVIAGASQLAAVQMMSENAPTIVVLLTGLAINLRMAMYSAALAPHLGAAPLWKRGLMAYFLVDQSYALSAVEFEKRPQLGLAAKTAYFFGVCVLICPAWYGSTWAGAVLGTGIPPGWGLDFAVPIAFIALIAPLLRKPAHAAAAFISVALALLLAFLPYNLGLMIAAIGAMLAGAWTESLLERRSRA